jgi:hypothetical protein
MKTLKIGAFAILGLLAVACNDDDDNNTAKLSSEEQAEMVASSLGESGLSGSAEQSAEYADEATGASGKMAECGYSATESANINGGTSLITFSLSYSYDVAVNCDDNSELESFTSEFEYEGAFDAPRFASQHSGSGFLTITSLDEENDDYEINGSYDRSGAFQSKIRNQASGNHTLDINVDAVTVNKVNKEITGGTASVSARGEIEGKGSYSFDADVTFNGDGTATIVVSGTTYNVDLETSTVVEVQ